MPKTLVVLVAIALLAGCAKAPVPPPDVKFASGSGPTHRVTLAIPDSFGAVGFVRASATYAMINQRTCMPMDHSKALGGRFDVVSQHVPLAVARSGRTFVVDVPRDPFLDEDYYGQGVCNWGISTIDFVADLPGRKLQPYVSWAHLAKTRGASLLCHPASHGALSPCFEEARVPPDHVGADAPVSVRID